jgi:hypothetical protein
MLRTTSSITRRCRYSAVTVTWGAFVGDTALAHLAQGVAVHRDLLAEHHQLEAEQDRKPHGSDGRSYLGYRHEIYDSYTSCETATKYIVGYGDSVSG